MLGFDETAFRTQIASAVGLRPQIEELVDRLLAQGIDNVLLVGAGGTYSQMWPYELLARERSTLPVRAAIAAELVVAGDALLSERTAAVFTSVTGTTEDVLRAIEFVKAAGATTISFTGHADSPIATGVDHALVSEPKTWPFDMQLLLLVGRLLERRGEFDGYASLADELVNLPDALVAAAEQAEPGAAAFAEAHRDTDYYFLIGGGPLWSFAYLYSMCILEEMQWLRTTRVHGAEFFHGSLELIDRDTSLLLFVGEDESRPLMERVIRFAEQYNDETTIIDTKDYALPSISPEFRGIVAPIVIDAITIRFSKHLEAARGHSLTTRRYYRTVEY
jgi:fructoselysine-6-phosphate deglycase